MTLQRVTFSVSEAVLVATEAIERRENRSRSSIFREAIEQYLQATEEMEMIAEYAEAADLNRALAEEHMEAFSEISAPGV